MGELGGGAHGPDADVGAWPVLWDLVEKGKLVLPGEGEIAGALT